MLGPLPMLYRIVVCVLALLACAGVGAWVAWTLRVPMMAPAGAVLGTALGVLVVALVLRDQQQPCDQPLS